MTHNLSAHRVWFREVFAWKIDLSIVERSYPDRDRAMLLRLWNRQHFFSVCPEHQLGQYGALADRCRLCGWAMWMRFPHQLYHDTLTP